MYTQQSIDPTIAQPIAAETLFAAQFAADNPDTICESCREPYDDHVLCADCEQSVCHDDRSSCGHCGAIICDSCGETCECGESMCSMCADRCDHCRTTTACRTECRSCGHECCGDCMAAEDYCNRCAIHCDRCGDECTDDYSTCESCEEPFCSDCITYDDDAAYCMACYNDTIVDDRASDSDDPAERPACAVCGRSLVPIVGQCARCRKLITRRYASNFTTTRDVELGHSIWRVEDYGPYIRYNVYGPLPEPDYIDRYPGQGEYWCYQRTRRSYRFTPAYDEPRSIYACHLFRSHVTGAIPRRDPSLTRSRPAPRSRIRLRSERSYYAGRWHERILRARSARSA